MQCQKLSQIVSKMGVEFLPLRLANIITSMVANLKEAVRRFMENEKRKNQNNFMEKRKIQIIKTESGFKPAELKNGKWVPIENSELQYTPDGELKIVKKDETDNRK